MAEKCKDLSPMVSFDLIVEPSDQVKKDVADDALSVDVRSVTPTMKAITFPKNAASPLWGGNAPGVNKCSLASGHDC